MTAFLSTFTNIVKSLLSLLFQWKVVGDVSIGSILVALFIIRVAFSILIKGANVRIDDMHIKSSDNRITDIKVDAGSTPRIGTHGFTTHDKYGG